MMGLGRTLVIEPAQAQRPLRLRPLQQRLSPAPVRSAGCVGLACDQPPSAATVADAIGCKRLVAARQGGQALILRKAKRSMAPIVQLADALGDSR